MNKSQKTFLLIAAVVIIFVCSVVISNMSKNKDLTGTDHYLLTRTHVFYDKEDALEYVNSLKANNPEGVKRALEYADNSMGIGVQVTLIERLGDSDVYKARVINDEYGFGPRENVFYVDKESFVDSH